MMPIYLLCGVSGSGKSWVCRQLTHKFHYVPHDEHFKDHPEILFKAAQTASKPLITESPFGERVLKEDLEKKGLTVIPYFVIEPVHVVSSRYLAREKKPLPQAARTRAITIKKRAEEWNALQGSSSEVLQLLQDLWI